MIELQKAEYEWEFMFLGANIDVIDVAERVGIHKDCATNFHSDDAGTALNYQVIDKTVSEIRKNKQISKDWKEAIDKDFIWRKN